MGRFSVVCLDCGNAPCEINTGFLYKCERCGNVENDIIEHYYLDDIMPEIIDDATIAAITHRSINDETSSPIREQDK